MIYKLFLRLGLAIGALRGAFDEVPDLVRQIEDLRRIADARLETIHKLEKGRNYWSALWKKASQEHGAAQAMLIEKIERLLLELGRIEEGQSYRDIMEEYAARNIRVDGHPPEALP